MPPRSDAITLNLLLLAAGDQPLRDTLWQLRRVEHPAVTYEDIAKRFNARVDEIADPFDVPPEMRPRYHAASVQRWCHEVYDIEQVRRRPREGTPPT